MLCIKSFSAYLKSGNKKNEIVCFSETFQGRAAIKKHHH